MGISSGFMRHGHGLAFLVSAVLLTASASIACDTPVYRYAMYRWFPAPYEVYCFYRGEMDETGKQLKAAVDQAGEAEEAPAAEAETTKEAPAAAAKTGKRAKPAAAVEASVEEKPKGAAEADSEGEVPATETKSGDSEG